MDEYVSTVEAFGILGVSRTTLWRFVRIGLIAPVRRKPSMFRRADIEALRDERAREAALTDDDRRMLAAMDHEAEYIIAVRAQGKITQLEAEEMLAAVSRTRERLLSVAHNS